MTDQPSPAPRPEAEPATSGPTEQERNWAMAAHLGSFLAAWFALGLVAPLIVMLVKGPESPFVRRHAVESLNFQITALIWIAVSVILMFVLIGFLVIAVFGLYYLVVVIMGGIAASRGQEYRYRGIIRLVA